MSQATLPDGYRQLMEGKVGPVGRRPAKRPTLHKGQGCALEFEGLTTW